MKKLIILCLLSLSSPLFGIEIIIQLTPQARAKIDESTEAGQFKKALNLRFEIVEEDQASSNAYCEFTCASPYRSYQTNAIDVFRPVMKPHAVAVYINSQAFGHNTFINMRFLTASPKLCNVTIPDDENINIYAKKYFAVIDYTNEKGFFTTYYRLQDHRDIQFDATGKYIGQIGVHIKRK